MRTIARREALRILAARREQPIAPEQIPGDIGPDLSRAEQRLDTVSAVTLLSAAEREVLYLRYWAGKSDRQIAALLSIPLGTIKVRIHRAHKKLGRSLMQ